MTLHDRYLMLEQAGEVTALAAAAKVVSVVAAMVQAAAEKAPAERVLGRFFL